MFFETSKWYDLLYGFKDYKKESEQIRELILNEKGITGRGLYISK